MQSIFCSLLLTMMMHLIGASNLINKWTNEDGFLWRCWTVNSLNRHLKIKFRYLYSSINLWAINGKKLMKETESEKAVWLYSNLIIIGSFNHVRHAIVLAFSWQYWMIPPGFNCCIFQHPMKVSVPPGPWRRDVTEGFQMNSSHWSLLEILEPKLIAKLLVETSELKWQKLRAIKMQCLCISRGSVCLMSSH